MRLQSYKNIAWSELFRENLLKTEPAGIIGEQVRQFIRDRRFSLASGTPAKIGPTIVQTSSSAQSAQVANPLDRTHFRMSQVDSQWVNFTPSMRHPVQLMDSMVISGDWNISLHFAATSFRMMSSFRRVAILASQFSQLIPQQEMS